MNVTFNGNVNDLLAAFGKATVEDPDNIALIFHSEDGPKVVRPGGVLEGDGLGGLSVFARDGMTDDEIEESYASIQKSIAEFPGITRKQDDEQC